MCTQTRRPSPSARTEIASSKSFAVSGSIVNVCRSRRSVRPSKLGFGRSCGSKPSRKPFSTSSASRTFSIALADPITRSTRARPRPSLTETRSPGSASFSPFRSIVIGVPGTKYGSPTSSLPRRLSSTISV